jgi:lantibiotic leader peptide-processing serine protease
MRRSSTLAVVAAAFLASACVDQATAPLSTPTAMLPAATVDAAVQGSFLVRASGNAFPSSFAARVQALGGRVIFAHNGAGVAAVSGLSDAAAEELSRVSGIAAVADDNFTSVGLPQNVGSEGVAMGVASPADPTTAARYSRQWNMRQIEAPAVWAAGRLGLSSTKVGILDTGLGYTHADLVGRVDFALSTSFVPSDDAIVAAVFPGAHPIADLHYHGTHVGATVSSNALAAAGVTSGTTLVGIKVCNVNGQCPTSGVLAGVLYAADNGLAVANLSLGGNFERRDASARGGVGPSFLAIINSVFNYASSKGTLVVVSAGNSGIDMDHDGNGYKAYCSAPSVVCVSATGPTAAGGVDGPFVNPDAIASYSNFGTSSINVAAPGGTAAAVVWAACSTFSLQIPVCRTGVFIVGLGGTSMAAPHVSGVAALVSEDVGRNPAQIRARLQQSADDLGQPGADPLYGKGRLNARAALGL